MTKTLLDTMIALLLLDKPRANSRLYRPWRQLPDFLGATPFLTGATT